MADIMTGRDLVLYIMKNKLEDKPLNDVWCLKDFITASEAAVKYEVGEETVKVWFAQGVLGGIQIGETLYISPVNINELKQRMTPITPIRAHDAFMRRNCRL